MKEKALRGVSFLVRISEKQPQHRPADVTGDAHELQESLKWRRNFFACGTKLGKWRRERPRLGRCRSWGTWSYSEIFCSLRSEFDRSVIRLEASQKSVGGKSCLDSLTGRFRKRTFMLSVATAIIPKLCLKFTLLSNSFIGGDRLQLRLQIPQDLLLVLKNVSYSDQRLPKTRISATQTPSITPRLLQRS